jgi:hypothetical protein
MSTAEVLAAFSAQIAACDALGSPFTANVLRACRTALSPETAVGRTILDWPGDPSPRGDSVPLRLAGALHALVMSGRCPDLAAFYPASRHEDPFDAVSAARAVTGALRRHHAFIDGFIARAPQTNEVARSAVLYAGLIALAARTGPAMEVLELGSSAGLNLLLDRFAHDLGGRRAGTPGSGVRLAPRWTGPSPQGPEPRIVDRRGCDLSPVDVRDPDEWLRLRSYVWADQAERLARLDAAVAIARAEPPPLDRMDATDWVGHRLARPQREGTTRVLMHSIAFQYLPEAGQARVRDAMEEAGSRSTQAAPLAWLSFEQAEGGPDLTLQVWPGGRTERLARADPHVSRVAWG